MAAMSRPPSSNPSKERLLQRFADNPIAATGGGSHPGSSFTFDYGTARVKAYPITDAELSRIGILRGLSSFFLAFGSILAGLCGTAVASLYLSTMPSEVLLAWKAGAWMTGGVCVVCYIITGVLIYHGHTETEAIKSRTSF
jgi:hypothetical protein